MVTGIEFFKRKLVSGFENCEETIKFTSIMNDLFDALNRRFPREGIKKNSKDIEVLIYVLHEHEFLCCVRIHVIEICVMKEKLLESIFLYLLKT